MDTIFAWRSLSSLFGPRALLLGFAIGLAAVLLPAAGAFADLQNQKEIDAAVKDYEDATNEARDNIPESEALKRREDNLDARSRARTNADEALAAAEAAKDDDRIKQAKDAANKAKELEEAARILADNARTTESNEADKQRAERYRQALTKRRAARLAMKTLEAVVKGWVRGHANAEVDQAASRLRVRITRSEQPITSKTVAALIPSWPMTANVSSDAQKHCTYGNATPGPVALQPADADGNPLAVELDPRLALALALLRVATTPIPIGNPDGAPQQGPQKEGGGGQTPSAGAPSPPGAGAPAAKPPETPAPTASAAPPKRPADTGIFGGKFNGEFAEDVIDRSSKLAEEALARGDKEGFVRHREKAREAAQWVVDRHRSSPGIGVGNLTEEWKTYLKEVSGWERDPSETPRRPKNDVLLMVKLPDGQFVTDAIDKLTKSAEAARGSKENFETYRSGLEALVRWAKTKLESMPRSFAMDAVIEEWRTYENEISGWQPQLPAASAEAAGRKPDATPKPSADAKPADPAVTPPRSSSPGEKSAPAPEKSTEKAETGDKPATPPAPSSEVAMPGPAGPDMVVTIHFKVTEAAMQEGASGLEIAESPKLTMPEPALPKPGRTRTAKDDLGHDKAPVTCVTNDGSCKAKLTGKEMKDIQALYRDLLKRPGDAATPGSNVASSDVADGDDDFVPAENYRVDLAKAKTTGVIIRKTEAQFTPAQLALLQEAPKGVEMVKSPFKAGDRPLTRVGLSGPDALTAKVIERLRELFGPDVRIDVCIDKQPGPPLGMTPVSLSALNSELPEATLGLSTRRGVLRR